MANQPVNEIRIGRVKATIWQNGTDERPRTNVTFGRLYRGGDTWKSTQSFGRERPPGAGETGRPGPLGNLPGRLRRERSRRLTSGRKLSQTPTSWRTTREGNNSMRTAGNSPAVLSNPVRDTFGTCPTVRICNPIQNFSR